MNIKDENLQQQIGKKQQSENKYQKKVLIIPEPSTLHIQQQQEQQRIHQNTQLQMAVSQHQLQDQALEAQRNIQTELRNVITTSKSLKYLQMLISLSKIIASSYLLLSKYNIPCQANLQLFLILMLVFDAISIITLIIQMLLAANIQQSNEFIQQQSQINQYLRPYLEEGLEEALELEIQQAFQYVEEKYPILKHISFFSGLFYFGLTIWGVLLIFFFSYDCREKSPQIYYLSFGYVILGIISYSFPILIIIGMCFCLPFLLVAVIRIIKGSQRPISKKALQQLKTIKYERQNINNEFCPICLENYNQYSNIIILPCNNGHFFHSACILKWLQINGICPICKMKVEDCLRKQNR